SDSEAQGRRREAGSERSVEQKREPMRLWEGRAGDCSPYPDLGRGWRAWREHDHRIGNAIVRGPACIHLIRLSYGILLNSLPQIRQRHQLMAPLNSRIALVTGASRGIGKSIAMALANAGADIAVNYSSNAAGAEFVCEQIRAGGRKAIPVQADVSKTADV